MAELKLFLNSYLPDSEQQSKSEALSGSLPFHSLDVWHGFGLIPLRVSDDPKKALIKARPLSSSGGTPHYDTVIVLVGNEAESTAIQGEALIS